MPRKPRPDAEPAPRPARIKRQVTLTLDDQAVDDLDWIAANAPGVDSRSAAARAAAAHYRRALGRK